MTVPSRGFSSVLVEGDRMNTIAFGGSFGWQEVALILVVVLILFGGKRLPGLARSLGRSIQEFKKGVKDIKDDIEAEATAPGDNDKESTDKASE